MAEKRFPNVSTEIHTPWQALSFDCVSDMGGFWQERRYVVQQKTARLCLDKCEATGRIANFRRAAKLEEGHFEGIYFNDSDVYKVLEGVAYLLADHSDPQLEVRADKIIDYICAAQWEDGYINTYYSLTDPDKRWTDMGMHEDYCIGHMIEGAIAYYQATGKNKWLSSAVRAVEHMLSRFGPGKRHWVTGHQGLELALVKLARIIDRPDFLDFSHWLVRERGHGHLDSATFIDQGLHSAYCQDDLPAESLSRVTGHAVRAMYYFSAMADLAALRSDTRLREALLRLHHNTVPANIYITGGIGQDARYEGFTRDYHLPNLTAYCETCAAIGMATWNHRMNLMEKEGSYADIVELELYNGALAGLALSGDLFFYDNPLASIGKAHRRSWFDCSCCPTNLMRFIPSVASYAYAVAGRTLVINQFFAGKLSAQIGGQQTILQVETDYPWAGNIQIHIISKGDAEDILVRIPGWCDSWHISAEHLPPDRCYVRIPLRDKFTIRIDLDMPLRVLTQDDRVLETKGRVAFARGPIVYCAEEADNPGYVREYFHADMNAPKGPAQLEQGEGVLKGMTLLRFDEALLVPFYAWDNREPGAMSVWMKH